MSSDAAPTPAPQDASAASAQGVSNPQEIPNFAGTKHKIEWEDGNAQELSYEDLVNDYKLSKREAARVKQLQAQLDPAMQFLSALQGGQLDTLGQLVPEQHLLAYAEKVLQDKIAWESKSPEERAFIQERKKLEREKREYEEWKSQREQDQKRQVEAQALQQVQQDIVEAINELGLGSKPSPRLVRRVAEQYLAQLTAGKTPDTRKASKYEWDNIQKELSDFQMMALKKDPMKFVESLPKEILEAIRDYEIKRATPFNRGTGEAPTPRMNSSQSQKRVVDFDTLENIYNPSKKKRAK